MELEKYLACRQTLGDPQRYIGTQLFAPTGTGREGTPQYWTVPQTGIFKVTAKGAAGSLGTHTRSDGTSYISTPGHGAILEANLALNAGDELMIIVGQRGSNICTAINDGASGGGGGGTFIFRKLAQITDARYQIEIEGLPYECLLVAAGGGGTQDNAYRRSTVNGYSAADELYSLTNFKACFTGTYKPGSNVNSHSGVYSLEQIKLYGPRGAQYSHNNNYGYGGYGCGGAADDSYTPGGGWCSSTSSTYSAASWAINGGNLSLDPELSDGQVVITSGDSTGTAVYAWWEPVFDRTLADCVYGNPKGCLDAAVLNRIESNIEFIQYLLDKHHLTATALSTKDTAWHRALYVKYIDMKRIEQNLKTLFNTGYTERSSALKIIQLSGSPIDYTLINSWEKLLYDMYGILAELDNVRRPLGTFNSGLGYTEQKLYLSY